MTEPRVARATFVAAAVALSLAMVAPAAWRPGHLPGEGVDLDGTLWFFDWTRRCVFAFADPSWTDAFYYPSGKNIFAHTGNNLVDAVLSIPLQLVLPGRTWYPAWLLVVLLSNAAAFRWLSAREIGDPVAGRIATLLFLVNPYVAGELASGRPTQAWLAFLIVALGGLDRVDEGARAMVTTGVAVALTGWTYWFYGYFFVAVAPCLAFAAWGSRPPAARWRYLAHLAGAAGVAALIVAPAVAHMAAVGRQSIPGVNQLDGRRALFQLPYRLVEAAGVPPQNYTVFEFDGPRMLGHPAWVLVVVAALLGRGSRRWWGVAAVGLVIAAGLSVSYGDRMVRNLPYVLAFNVVPFLERLWFPNRALAVVFVAVAVLGGAALARVRGLEARLGAVATTRLQVGLGVGWIGLALVSLHQDLGFPLPSEDVRPRPVYAWMAERPGAVVELPFGRSDRAVRDQPAHGMPLYGGMAEGAAVFLPPSFRAHQRNSFFRALSQATSEQTVVLGVRADDREAALDEGFRWVVLHRDWLVADPAAAVAAVEKLLGPPVAVDGPRVVWSLDPAVASAPAAFDVGALAAAWPEEGLSTRDAALRAQGRLK